MVIVIEDDPLMRIELKTILQLMGLSVLTAKDGVEGHRLALTAGSDLIVCDVRLPGMNGVPLVRSLRAHRITTPIVMLSVAGTPEDKVLGLDSGADDYIAKPYHRKELEARIKALLRRSGSVAAIADIIEYGDVRIDRNRGVVYAGNVSIDLGPTERSLLECLLVNPEYIHPQRILLEQVWGISHDPGTNIVAVQACRLRKKLHNAGSRMKITSLKGLGYRLEDPDAAVFRR